MNVDGENGDVMKLKESFELYKKSPMRYLAVYLTCVVLFFAVPGWVGSLAFGMGLGHFVFTCVGYILSKDAFIKKYSSEEK